MRPVIDELMRFKSNQMKSIELNIVLFIVFFLARDFGSRNKIFCWLLGSLVCWLAAICFQCFRKESVYGGKICTLKGKTLKLFKFEWSTS